MCAIWRWITCCALLSVAHVPFAAELKVLATDPAPDALLARQQPFFVRFEIKNATPVAVTVSGLYSGKAVIDDGGTDWPWCATGGFQVGQQARTGVDLEHCAALLGQWP